MSGNLYYTPGQTVTFFQEVLNADHQRVDDGYTPVVTQILSPLFVQLCGYPQNMTHYDTGLWVFQFKIPKERHHRHHDRDHDRDHFDYNDKHIRYEATRFNTSCAPACDFPSPSLSRQYGCDGYDGYIGTYLVDIAYQSPDTGLIVNDKRQVIVFEPFGPFKTNGRAVDLGHRFPGFHGRAW